MTKRITMLSPIQGGTAYGLLTIAGSPYTVDDALAADLVNRGVAVFTDPPVPTSVYATFVTYMTAAQFAQVAVGAAGVTYEITDAGGRPQYRWNGSAFVAIGSGGGGGGGFSPTTEIPFNAVLNLSGNNSYPDSSPGPGVTLTPGAPANGGASLAFNLVGDGNDITIDPRFIQNGDAYNKTINRINSFLVGVSAGKLFMNIFDTQLNVPRVTGAVIQNTAKDKVVFTANGVVVTAPAAGDITIHTSGAAKTITGVVKSGSTFTGTLSAPASPGEVLTFDLAAGKLVTAGGTNFAIAAQAIVNNAQVAGRSDNFSSNNLTASDGGAAWSVISGAYSKLAGPARFGRPNATALELSLPNLPVLFDETVSVKMDAAPACGLTFGFRFTDANNWIPLIFTPGNRLDLYPVIGGAGSLAARVDGALTLGVVNTIRVYVVETVPGNNDFNALRIDINGTHVPDFDYDITAAAIKTGTKLYYALDNAEPQNCYMTNLAG